MGKQAKRIKKNMIIDEQKNNTSGAQKESAAVQGLLMEIEQAKESGQYEQALEIIIAAFEKGYADRALMKQTACIYYALGDYQRTILWTGKSLGFGKDVEMSLLQAKVYALQDDMNHCFTALEDMMKEQPRLSEKSRAEIEDLLNYFAGDYEADDLATAYPALYDFIHAEKQDNSGAADGEQSVKEEISVSAAVQEESDLVDRDDYSCLKGKSIDEVIAAIMQQPISLVEKVDLCLQFSVHYYLDKDYVKTLRLLKQALQIDGKNDLVLKNTGAVLLKIGEKAGALKIFAEIKEKDLMVLEQIAMLERKK